MRNKGKEYVRDKRSPRPKDENTSRVMRSNKAKDTKPELLLRKALWSNNIKGYRLHHKTISGTPDIVFISKRTAIFVHGCYWHRCPKCNLPLPKNNQDFWKLKFEKNIIRDQNKVTQLESEGWRTLTIWECELKSDLGNKVKEIKEIIKQN